MRTPRRLSAVAALALLGLTVAAPAQADPAGSSHVGRQPDGSVVLPTGQRITPAGRQVEFPGRTTAVSLSPDKVHAAFLSSQGAGTVTVVDLATGAVTGSLAGGAGSFDGLSYNHDGSHLFASLAGGTLVDAAVGTDGALTTAGTVSTPRVLPGSRWTPTRAATTPTPAVSLTPPTTARSTRR